MPTTVDTLLELGSDELDAHASELAEFRGVSTRVTIDRSPAPIPEDFERPNNAPKYVAMIRVRVKELDDAPEIGESFKDENLVQFRIMSVDVVGGDCYCRCHGKPYNPETESE